jgi:hypothetical protein
MNATVASVNTPSNRRTGASRRLGFFSAVAVAVLSSLAVAGAAPSGPAHGSGKPSSAYAQIDTSDHPTNPASCRTRYTAC